MLYFKHSFELVLMRLDITTDSEKLNNTYLINFEILNKLFKNEYIQKTKLDSYTDSEKGVILR